MYQNDTSNRKSYLFKLGFGLQVRCEKLGMENTESQKNPEEQVSSDSSQDSQSEEAAVADSDKKESDDDNTKTKKGFGQFGGSRSPGKDRDI